MHIDLIAATRRNCVVLLAAMLVLGLIAACDGSSPATPPTDAQVIAMLNRHAAAVREHDRSAFEAGLDTRSGAVGYRTAQDAAFGNLTKLSFTTFAYAIAARVTDASAQAAARTRFGPSARIVKVTLRYALHGVDTVPSEHSLWWTFADVGGQVVVCADDGLANAGGVSWTGPWDFGSLAVVHGRSSLVLGPSRQVALLRQIAVTADTAVPAVTAVWGTSWAREVEIVVPSSSAALAAALGETDYGASSSAGETGDIAAVTVSDGQDPLTGRVQGQRIVLEPDTFEQLSTLGRRITLTHEVTHVASAVATSGSSPRWVVEGFAEYVANLGTGEPVRTAASELVDRIRRRGLPGGLPADDMFDSSTAAPSAYEQAWLACRLIASRAGQYGLVRFYRQVGTSGLLPRAAVAHGLRSVLNETPSAFADRWRTSLRAQLG